MQKSGDKEIVEELFDIKIKAYGRLQPLQGVTIPTFYGTLRYNGMRPMLLERLGGISMSSPEAATLRLEELSALLQPCYRAIDAFHVAVDDTNLSNFQLVDGRVMMMDLESAVFRYPADQRARFLASNIKHLADVGGIPAVLRGFIIQSPRKRRCQRLRTASIIYPICLCPAALHSAACSTHKAG